MGTTIHERVTIETVQMLLEQNPVWSEVLSKYHHKMMTGFFDQQYLDTILQKYERSPYDIYDAFNFALVHTAIARGSILLAKVYLGIEPQADRLIDENNAALSALPYPFKAEFWGGLADQDGNFEWCEPINFGQILPDGQEVNSTIPPMTLPLEVGYTQASKTVQHLSDARGLARWPYDSEFIHLFKVVNPNLFSVVATMDGIDDPYENRSPPVLQIQE